MLRHVVLMLLLTNLSLSAVVNPIPGENFWQILFRVGTTVDVIESLSEVIESKVDDLDMDLISTGDVLCSKLDSIDENLKSVSDVLCSKLEVIDEENDIMRLSISDYLCSKMIAIDEDNDEMRVSISDVLCSKLESVSECLTGIAIMQEDIPLTISTPGLYTLCENVRQAGTTPAITIAADDVTFDLNGYTITTTGTGSRGFFVDNQANIAIKNGKIEPNREAVVVQGSLTDCVLLQDLEVCQPADIGIKVDNAHAVTIERCSVSGNNGNATGESSPSAFWFGVTSAEESLDVRVHNCHVTGNDMIGQPQCGYTLYAFVPVEEVHMEIVNSTSHFTLSDGFLIRAGNIVGTFDYINCKATRAGGSGFAANFLSATTADRGLSYDGCIAKRNSSAGFEIARASNILFKNCNSISNGSDGWDVTQIDGLQMFLCCSEGNSENGYKLENQDVVMKECIAQSNGLNGVLITGEENDGGFIAESCDAHSNESSGFNVDAEQVTLKNCTAQNNSFDGFLTSSLSTGVQINQCCANNNVSDGFALLASDTVAQDCIATRSTRGFYMPALGADDISLVGCAASSCTTGFDIDVPETVLKNCVATHNTTGIDVAVGAISVEILNSCAKNNTVNIFDAAPSTNFINLETAYELLCSKLEDIDAENDIMRLSISDYLCSKMIAIDEDNDEMRLSISDALCTKLTDLDGDVANVDANVLSVGDALCTKIVTVENKLDVLTDSTLDGLVTITENISSICDKIMVNMEQIDSLSDNVCDKLSDLDSMVTLARDDIIQAVCSKIEIVDQNTEFLNDIICSKVEVIGFDTENIIESISDFLCSKLEAIDIESDITRFSISDVLCTKIGMINADELICSFSDEVTTQVNCLVGTPLRSADFPVTISTPGLYRLCENVSHAGAAVAITIASDDVTLDLGGYTLSTTMVTSTPVSISSRANVKVQNGSLRPAREALFITDSSAIEVQDIAMYDVGEVGLRVVDSRGVIIERCFVNGFNGAVGTGVTNPGAFWFGIIAPASDGVDVIVRDCSVVGNTFGGSFESGFSFYASDPYADSKLIVENSSVSGDVVRGFRVQDRGDGSFVFRNCVAHDCSSDGFIFDRASGTAVSEYVIESCRAISSGVGFNFFGLNQAVCRSCVAYNNVNGYFVAFPTPTAEGLIFDNCIAENNTSLGYRLDGNDTLCVECSSVSNGFGFFITGDRNILKRCIATNCSTGLSIAASAADTQILDSCAKNNTANISDSSATTNFVNLETVSDILCSKLDSMDSKNDVLCSKLDNLDSKMDVILAGLGL